MNHFMEGCFTFQWGAVCFVFQMAGAGGFIYKWGGGCTREATLVLMGGNDGCARPIRAPPPPLWETLCADITDIISALHAFFYCACIMFSACICSILQTLYTNV